MKRVKFSHIVIFLFLISTTAYGQLELTGFFDVNTGYDFTQERGDGFFINQFELDISYLKEGKYSLGTAIAYNPETEGMELAMAFLHINFVAADAMHPRREELLPHAGVVIGKFDVKFGLDYLSYASPDRPGVRQPIVVENSIGGWNDTGIDAHIVSKYYDVDLWVLNGFHNGFNLGGNLRLKPFDFFKVGYSHASDFIQLKNREGWINGLDATIELENFEIKTEYLWTKGLYCGEQDSVQYEEDLHGGFYFQLLTDLQEITTVPLYMMLRYGFCSSDSDRDLNGINDHIDRYTLAIGYQFSDNLSIRSEFMTDHFEDKSSEASGILQMVVAF